MIDLLENINNNINNIININLLENKLFLTAIVILITVAFSSFREWYKQRKADQEAEEMKSELYIPKHYQVDWLDLDERTDKYENLREQVCKKYETQEEEGEEWMSTLPEEPKEMMKFLLMARIVCTLHIYDQTETAYKSNAQLYQNNVITKTYWDSIVEAIESLKRDLEMLKDDMIALEPSCKPSDVFGEAWRILNKFGPEWPNNANKKQCPPGCMCETSKKLRVDLEERTKNCAADCGCDASKRLRAEKEALGRRAKGENLCPPGCQCDKSKKFREELAEKTKNCPENCQCNASKRMRAEKEALEGRSTKTCPPGCNCDKSQKERADRAKAGKSLPEDILGPFGVLDRDGMQWKQSPPPDEEVEITFRVPTNLPKDKINVTFEPNKVTLTIDGETAFNPELLEKIKPDQCSWTVTQDPIGTGDAVLLKGLSNKEFNGKKGMIRPTDKDTREKGRWKIATEMQKELSIKEENLDIQNPKGRLVVTLEKAVSKPWPNPPFEGGSQVSGEDEATDEELSMD